ncbi:MAG: biotin--[acetyl-CoA-carboxylase] ligase [Armatimonadetes bacterium]|nr:biotin--[acetyl-CoA-carboxylase] ligase [Armatimonadota bacterium]
MKGTFAHDTWMVLDEVDSTQTVVAKMIERGEDSKVVYAAHQTAGKGRFDRHWLSNAGDSLTISIPFPDYADHPKPWLIGMAVAVAAAGAVHAKVRWPNDIVLDGKKCGGILTEIFADSKGRRIPVVGLGLNLNQTEMPEEIAETATSLAIHRSGQHDPVRMAKAILDRLEGMPEPEEWESICGVWMHFDATPGKKYQLPNGDIAIAIGIGPDGELIASVDGETTSIMVADALFGPQ